MNTQQLKNMACREIIQSIIEQFYKGEQSKKETDLLENKSNLDYVLHNFIIFLLTHEKQCNSLYPNVDMLTKYHEEGAQGKPVIFQKMKELKLKDYPAGTNSDNMARSMAFLCCDGSIFQLLNEIPKLEFLNEIKKILKQFIIIDFELRSSIDNMIQISKISSQVYAFQEYEKERKKESERIYEKEEDESERDKNVQKLGEIAFKKAIQTSYDSQFEKILELLKQ